MTGKPGAPAARRPLRRFREWWAAFWFPEDRELSLAVCRILAVAAQLFVFLPSLGLNIELLASRGGFLDPQYLIRGILAVVPAQVFLTPETFTVLHSAAVVAGGLCLIGLFTRTAAFVFALGNWIFIAHGYSYGEEHHPEAILCMFLMMLALSPSGRRLSVDALLASRRRRRENGDAGRENRNADMAGWPLRLTQVLLAVAYFSTGVAKLAYGGLEWLNGYTLRYYLFGSSVPGLPLGTWLAQQHELAVLLSAFTILFELFFFVAVLVPRTAPLFVAFGTLFHVGIHFAMGANFWSHILLYATFVNFDGLGRRVREWWASGVESAATGRTSSQVAVPAP